MSDIINLQVIALHYLLRKKRETRRMWQRQIFAERHLHGYGNALLPRLRERDPELFANFTRMSSSQFDFLLTLVRHKICKKRTRLRQPIDASDRLAICLRFLVTGASFSELSFGFRVGKSTICAIIQETCEALIEVLKPSYMNMPSSADEWKEIAVGFEHRWNFPHCVGAIDGKHVAIQAPPSSGSSYINYKGFHSIVLMAACDAFYCFTFVDIGDYGRISDGGVFSNTSLAQKLNHSGFLPPDCQLPESTKVAPYVFVADEAFPLKPNLLRPYPGQYLDVPKRTFNYRLSRARRCVENAFGILTSRWRILRTTITLSPEKAALVTMACCCLHNFLMKIERSYANKSYCPTSFADSASENGAINEGTWRGEAMLPSVQRRSGGRASDAAILSREIYQQYFMDEGYVPWQDTV